MDEFIRLNAVFQPPKEVEEYAIRKSQEFAKHGDAYFALDGNEYFPHITIYSPEFPKHNFEKFFSAVQGIADHCRKPFVLDYDGIETMRGFVVANFKKTAEHDRFHALVLEKLNPLREGHVRKLSTQSNYTGEQIRNEKEFGHHNVFSLYHPHITLLRFKDPEDAPRHAPAIVWDIPQFSVSKLAIYEMGEHGTCRKQIQEFPMNI